MRSWPPLIVERRTVASPIWIRLRDAFTGAPPRGPLSVTLERRVDATWTPFEHRHQLSPSGDLAFVNLGRSHDPATVGSFDVRITVGCPGMIAEAANGDPAVTTTVHAWAPDAPAAPAQPVVLSFFPSPAYAYPAGLPLLAGRVIDADDAPVYRARVSSTVTVMGTDLTEEVRTDVDGYFRLPLRWSAGATDVKAAHLGRTAVTTISVPADLSTTQQLTLP
jgi:Carboxypeptidase regulatory-like domain